VVRQAIDFLRKQSLPAAEASDEIPSPDQDAPNALAAREIEDALAAALTTLSHRDRLLIELHFRREFAAEKVASVLRTSVGAFYTQKSRILAKLRESLARIPSL
jgi:RNA polymerase sigma factor (sigma-70 family)